MEEQEKAEEYVKNEVCIKICPTWKAHGGECDLFPKCHYVSSKIKFYRLGLTEGRKEKCFEQNKDGTICPCEVMKENEKLKTELMHLKGCEQCKDRPEGEIATVCPTEYEDHCIGQKITHIQELEAQNKDLCESLDIMNSRESELLEQIEKLRIEIEEKQSIITEQKLHCEAVDNVNYQLRCCHNCKNFIDKSYCITPCEEHDKWEMAE